MVPREHLQVSLQFPARGGVSPLHPVRSTAKNLNLATALREHEKPAPHRAGIATLTGQESAAESEPERAANRTWITARIDGPGHPGIGNGNNQPNPPLKEKLSAFPNAQQRTLTSCS